MNDDETRDPHGKNSANSNNDRPLEMTSNADVLLLDDDLDGMFYVECEGVDDLHFESDTMEFADIQLLPALQQQQQSTMVRAKPNFGQKQSQNDESSSGRKSSATKESPRNGNAPDVRAKQNLNQIFPPNWHSEAHKHHRLAMIVDMYVCESGPSLYPDVFEVRRRIIICYLSSHAPYSDISITNSLLLNCD
jgi:hypothetical protein